MNFSVTPDHGVNPLTVTFTAIPQPTATAYNWDFGDGTTGEGITVQHIYNGGGPYSVSLTITVDGGTIFSSKGGAVIVSRVGNIPAVFDGYIFGPMTGFPSGPAPLQVVFSGLNSDNSFVWDFGDGTTQDLGKSGNPKTAHVYSAPGKYTVKLTATQYDSMGFKFQSAFERDNYVTVT